MKKNALLCATFGIISMISAGAANAWCFSPYVGIDAQGRHADLNSKFGQNVFKHDYPQGNIYAGVRLSDYLGLEAGYEWTKRVHRTVTIGAGQSYLGSTLSTITAPQVSVATSQIDGWHANIVGFLPVSEEYCADLFVSVGLVQMRAYFQPTIILGAGNVSNNPRSFRKTKTIARANVGMQSIIIGNFGARITVGWENTSRITAYQTDQFTSSPTIMQRVKMKDSINYGVGIFFSFL